MEFHLLTTLHSEIDSTALKSLLEGQGIKVNVNAVRVSAGVHSMAPDTFGVYVDKEQLAEAVTVLQNFTPLMGKSAKTHSAFKTYAYVIVVGFLILFAYWIFQMFKYISKGFPF